jgi:hypothetical protein
LLVIAGVTRLTRAAESSEIGMESIRGTKPGHAASKNDDVWH